jgi:hypothetical protein
MAQGIWVCVLVGEHHHELSATASSGSVVRGDVVVVERILDDSDYVLVYPFTGSDLHH